MAQALTAAKPSVSKQHSYVDLDNNDQYEKYRGNCGLAFSKVVTAQGGYTKWFESTFAKFEDNVYDSDKKITFGVTFGGLMRDRLKFPKIYTYDYDIILRIVRGEKRFIGGYLSSQEYVYNLYISTRVENQDEIVSKFLKQFNIIPKKVDASIYKDKRRSLSLGTANSQNAVNLLVDRTSQQDAPSDNNNNDKTDNNNDSANNNNDNTDSSNNEKKDNNNESSVNSDDSSKYEHRVCNAHSDATDDKIKADTCLSDIKERVGNNYSVRVIQGIPDFSSMKTEDETDIIVSFVRDDIFRFQATYLKKETFNGQDSKKKEVYDALYKWPKSAKEIFGSNIPKQKTKDLLSVCTTLSTTKVDIKS